MKTKEPKIFVSYTIRDGKVDKDFLLNLESFSIGYGCIYIDLIHNDSENKQVRVMKELSNSNVVIIIKTDDVYKSEWVNKELNYAKESKIPIYELEYDELINNKFLPITTCINHWSISN
tara:strand:+ start:119 stop:475 length:357 start_codon:yes stop_codon:yes gene_type:complete